MEERADIFNNYQVRWGVIFYALYLFVCMLIKNTDWFNSYTHLFWMELLLAAITLVFVWMNRHALQPALRLDGLRWFPALLVIVLAVAFWFVSQYIIALLHVKVRNVGVDYYSHMSSYFSPEVVMVYSVALTPALFEELAFRGVLYQYFSAATDEVRVVVITAAIFAIMHLNSIALVWLFPLGLWLGYLRKKHHTVWYGVLFHFTFNFLICLQAMYPHQLLPFALPQ
ncbi:CAAX protease self-immunity [Filimonas lacunae]|uniref:CAAX protease self-immunity n=1 Tax=Filimonas lacunae TaxID=477680 RepID=A0A1N7M0Q9_9BACT|nr:type II CAAX endopeptidase family protein [Filimonas lacunae]SIS79675.1 CAAX protease self-immunity [Filimonas lacunae]